MNCKLTISERLGDLRNQRGITLEELAAQTNLSRSALSSYEKDEYKDISPHAIVKLAEFYGVSTDYLLGRTENKNHPNTELTQLHLSDKAIDVLCAGRFNTRLLSEMIAHEGFKRLMLDAEIYVDQVASMRIRDLNISLEATRQIIIEQHHPEEDVTLRTLEVAQVNEDEYFRRLLEDDLHTILRGIRDAHSNDASSGDDKAIENMKLSIREAMNTKGTPLERGLRVLLKLLGINYDGLKKEDRSVFKRVLGGSKMLKFPISLRGKEKPSK